VAKLYGKRYSVKTVMRLEISQREREGIALIDLKGRLTAGDEVGSFRAAVEAATASTSNVILNLQLVDFIDSTGLGAMVMCATRLAKAGGAMKLAFLNRRNMELIVLTRLDTVFEIFADETEAVNSFFPDREIKKFDILSFVRNLKDD
jgi:anti-sigma B factor antagonist